MWFDLVGWTWVVGGLSAWNEWAAFGLILVAGGFARAPMRSLVISSWLTNMVLRGDHSSVVEMTTETDHPEALTNATLAWTASLVRQVDGRSLDYANVVQKAIGTMVHGAQVIMFGCFVPGLMGRHLWSSIDANLVQGLRHAVVRRAQMLAHVLCMLLHTIVDDATWIVEWATDRVASASDSLRAFPSYLVDRIWDGAKSMWDALVGFREGDAVARTLRVGQEESAMSSLAAMVTRVERRVRHAAKLREDLWREDPSIGSCEG